MPRRAHAWIAVFTLTACGTAGVRPDEMSARAHRREAAYERRTAEEREHQASQETAPAPTEHDPYHRSQVTLDPASRLRAEAESRRAHALEHEAAARELERSEAQECARIEPPARASCPVLRRSGLRDIPGGVRIDPFGSADPGPLLTLMRCQLAYARSHGFDDEATCPLFLRGTEIRVSADGKAVEVVGGSEALAREIRRRSRELSIAGPEAKAR